MKEQIYFTKEQRTIRQESRCLNHSNQRNFKFNIQSEGRIKDFWKVGSYV